jgi:hypothetical protein
MDQPTPKVTHADVERIARRDFGNANAAHILSILDEYQSAEPSRVQLAVLKLAASNTQAVKQHIAIAKVDYRDVLAAAEYPRYTRDVVFRDIPEAFKKEVTEEDWKQYDEWLSR